MIGDGPHGINEIAADVHRWNVDRSDAGGVLCVRLAPPQLPRSRLSTAGELCLQCNVVCVRVPSRSPHGSPRSPQL